MVYVFLAPGFEEGEAIVPIDLMLRAGISVTTVGIGAQVIPGAHGIAVTADVAESQLTSLPEDAEMILLPGGMPGVTNLQSNKKVVETVQRFAEQDKFICAICAAPLVLDDAGILDGKKFTCYPSTVSQIKTGEYCDKAVVADGKIITGKGVGTALDLGLAMVAIFCSEEKSESLKKAIVYGV